MCGKALAITIIEQIEKEQTTGPTVIEGGESSRFKKNWAIVLFYGLSKAPLE